MVNNKFIMTLILFHTMTRWKKDEKEFSVSINILSNRDGSTSQVCTIPKLIIELLKDPEKIKFVIHGKGIVVISD